MSCFTPEFIKKIANEFRLNEIGLRHVLLTAEDEHDCQSFTESGRESFRECVENFKKIKKSLDRAVTEIQNCTDGEKEELEFFKNLAFKTECLEVQNSVEDQLNYLSDLFSQFDAFYRDGPGRPPAKSRDLSPVYLSALEAFTRELRVYWCKETGTRFGQDFRLDYTDAESDPDSGTLKPENKASKFLCACAKQLDRRYEAKHCRTVMKNLNKGSPQGFRSFRKLV